MNKNQLQTLLAHCEERLLESRQRVEEALSLVQQASSVVGSVSAESNSAIGIAFASQRDELVKMVLAALDSGQGQGGQANDFLNLLVRSEDDDEYRIGRRQLALTDSEKQILDLLWDTAPAPVDRAAILDHLYSGKEKPSSGVIDVFMSKLRQKLKLASDGRDFIRSSRGKGWSLNQDLCREQKSQPANNGDQRRRA
ncbi:MAG TPA: helix-turn-helix domain-containing protein [Sphingomonas sp.]|nr:helix-turn-helix domain-containing protein [Sphingomonas sp.]